MGIFRTNSEAGKPIRTWPQRLNSILESICEAIGIQMDTNFTGPQVIPISQKGAPNGVCELDANGKIPISRIPASQTSAPNIVPLTGADGKLSPTFFSQLLKLPYTAATLGTVGPISQPGSALLPIGTPSGSLSSLFDGTRFVLPANSGVYLIAVACYLLHYGAAALAIPETLADDTILVTPGTEHRPAYISAFRFYAPPANAPLNIRPRITLFSLSEYNIPSAVNSAGGANSNIVIVKMSGA